MFDINNTSKSTPR